MGVIDKEYQRRTGDDQSELESLWPGSPLSNQAQLPDATLTSVANDGTQNEVHCVAINGSGLEENSDLFITVNGLIDISSTNPKLLYDFQIVIANHDKSMSDYHSSTSNSVLISNTTSLARSKLSSKELNYFVNVNDLGRQLGAMLKVDDDDQISLDAIRRSLDSALASAAECVKQQSTLDDVTLSIPKECFGGGGEHGRSQEMEVCLSRIGREGSSISPVVESSQPDTRCVRKASDSSRFSRSEVSVNSDQSALRLGEDVVVHLADVNEAVLNSGVAIFLGSCDVTRHASSVVVVFCRHAAWAWDELCVAELTGLLLYYAAIPPRAGLTLIVDARGSTDAVLNKLLQALAAVEASSPNAVGLTHMLADRNAQSLLWWSPLYKPTIQIDLLMNIEALHRVVEPSFLPLELGGVCEHSQRAWVLSQQIKELIGDCRQACVSLANEAHSLSIEGSNDRIPGSRLDAARCLEQFESRMAIGAETQRMQIVSKLESLRQKIYGTSSLELRVTLEDATAFYSHLEDVNVRWRKVLDERRTTLLRCLRLRSVEEQVGEIMADLSVQGDRVGHQFSDVYVDSLQGIESMRSDFQRFQASVTAVIGRAKDLLKELDVMTSSGEFNSVKGLAEVSARLSSKVEDIKAEIERVGTKIDNTALCYRLVDEAYEWAMEATRYVLCLTVDCPPDSLTPPDIDALLHRLAACPQRLPPISDERFGTAIDWCRIVGDDRLSARCVTARGKCVEALNLLRHRQDKLLNIRRVLLQRSSVTSPHSPGCATFSAPLGAPLGPPGVLLGPPRHQRPLPAPHRATWSFDSEAEDRLASLRRRSYAGKPSTPMYGSAAAAFKRKDLDIQEYEEYLFSEGLITEDMSDRIVASLPKGLSDSTMRGSRESLRSSRESLRGSQDSLHLLHPLQPLTAGGPLGLSALASRSWECLRGGQGGRGAAPAPNTSSPMSKFWNPLRRMSTGRNSLNGSSVSLQTGGCEGAMATMAERFGEEGGVGGAKEAEGVDSTMLLTRLMSEMVDTEHDYVHALAFIRDVYVAAMSSDDLPQALRGKRSVVFGNLERLIEFHSGELLWALEGVRATPLAVGSVFLKHRNSFFLYAMYSKNKPKSDCLMAECGNAYFKKKQMEIGDQMDLSSYLLKPVQRVGKYALLLSKILKHCRPHTEHEYAQFLELQEALEMVRFQLRHGNDLLAMDCIRDCDVNLQEQGMLLRQEDFTVCHGLKKCRRRVFLFEETILLTKAKHKGVGNDCYSYKTSFKMSDLGLTEKVFSKGDDTKFEVWFRKRAPSNGATYTLQSERADIKQVWVRDISRLLWKQAIRNRALSLSETQLCHKHSVPLHNAGHIADNELAAGSPPERNIIPRVRNSIAVTTFDRFRLTGRRCLEGGGVRGNASSPSSVSCPSTASSEGVFSSPSTAGGSELDTTIESPFEEDTLFIAEPIAEQQTTSRQRSCHDSRSHDVIHHTRDASCRPSVINGSGTLGMMEVDDDATRQQQVAGSAACTMDSGGYLCTDV